MEPIPKWAGGERRLLDELRTRSPESYDSHHEPSFGGGAVFSETAPDDGTIDDTDQRLVNFYVVTSTTSTSTSSSPTAVSRTTRTLMPAPTSTSSARLERSTATRTTAGRSTRPSPPPSHPSSGPPPSSGRSPTPDGGRDTRAAEAVTSMRRYGRRVAEVREWLGRCGAPVPVDSHQVVVSQVQPDVLVQAGLDRGDEAVRGVLVVESDLVLVGDGYGVKDHVDRVPARRPLDRTFGPEVSVRPQSVEQPHLDGQFLAGDPAGSRL